MIKIFKILNHFSLRRNFHNFWMIGEVLRIFIRISQIPQENINKHLMIKRAWSTCQSLRITINTTLPLDEFTRTLFRRKTILIGDLAESLESATLFSYACFDVSRAYFHRGRNHMAILPKVRGYFRPGFTILRARRKPSPGLRFVGGAFGSECEIPWDFAKQASSLDNDGRRVRVTSIRRFHSKADPSFVHVYFARIPICLWIRGGSDVAKEIPSFLQVCLQATYVPT